jgi:hypothetical protein
VWADTALPWPQPAARLVVVAAGKDSQATLLVDILSAATAFDTHHTQLHCCTLMVLGEDNSHNV